MRHFHGVSNMRSIKNDGTSSWIGEPLLDSREVIGMRHPSPLVPVFFIFMQYLTKILPNIRLAYPHSRVGAPL